MGYSKNVIDDVALDQVLQKVWDGGRIGAGEALKLHSLPLGELGALADRRRDLAKAQAYSGKGNQIVTYIVDRNVNYTNVCNVYCKFCAFYRTERDTDAYVITHPEIDRKIEETIALGGTQILMQGGHHPKLSMQWYLDLLGHIKTKFPNLHWIADKIVSGGCSKRRPDLLLDLIYQIVIIEIDENQHADYDCACQNKRTMELSQDVRHRPIVFIRFNPDDYKKDGTNITSCWGQNKKGICVIKKSKKDEWVQRLNILEEHINYWLNPENTTNKTVETIQLFYDV